jgi:serine/threonine protein kinase
MNVDNADTGSLCYMAPEILSGKTKIITPLVDVWSMGVILFEMLFGKLPFHGKDILNQIVTTNFEIPPDHNITEDCEDVLNRMLDKNPDRRITTFDL